MRPVLVRVSPPASRVVSVQDCRDHSQITASDFDTKIEQFLAAAESIYDGPNGRVGKALITQQWSMTVGRAYGSDAVAWAVPPLRSIVGVSYYDAANAQQALDPAGLRHWGGEDRPFIAPVHGTTWPVMYDREDALTITCECGFGDAQEIPESIHLAILMQVADWFENREATRGGVFAPTLEGPESLINDNRIGWFGG